MKLFSRILPFLRNKFLLTIVCFAVWMIFFDRNDVFTQQDRLKELNMLQESKKYYTEQIAAEKKVLEELQSDPAAIEKYAREKYMMKRENEDIFLIQPAGKD